MNLNLAINIGIILFTVWYVLCGFAVALLNEKEHLPFDKNASKLACILMWPILLSLSVLFKNEEQ